jgi:hypothetical protein
MNIVQPRTMIARTRTTYLIYEYYTSIAIINHFRYNFELYPKSSIFTRKSTIFRLWDEVNQWTILQRSFRIYQEKKDN